MGRHSGRAPLWRESRNPVNTGLLLRVIPPPGRLAWAASRLDFVQKRPAAITGFRLSLARARSAGMTIPGDLYKASKKGAVIVTSVLNQLSPPQQGFTAFGSLPGTF